MSRISKMTGIPVETVRYKLKRQLARMGFRIHAQPNYPKLGLSLYWATLRFATHDAEMSNKVLDYLNQNGYLVYYSRELPTGRYSTNFAIPSGTENECRSNLNMLVKNKILTVFELEQVTYTQHHSMNPIYFNFRSGRWEVDWPKVRSDTPPPFKVKSIQPVSFDRYDLLLLKELQIDALQHTTDIAEKLKVATPVLGYHYRTHLQRNNLVDGYMIRWMQDTRKKLAHTATITRLRIPNLKQKELHEAHDAISKLPFTWSEHFTDKSTFISTLVIPVEEALSTFDYLNGEMPHLADRVEISFVKVQDAMLFTIPYNMFDRGWKREFGELGPGIKKIVKA